MIYWKAMTSPNKEYILHRLSASKEMVRLAGHVLLLLWHQ